MLGADARPLRPWAPQLLRHLVFLLSLTSILSSASSATGTLGFLQAPSLSISQSHGSNPLSTRSSLRTPCTLSTSQILSNQFCFCSNSQFEKTKGEQRAGRAWTHRSSAPSFVQALSMASQKKAAVIGAGAAGLAAANRLRSQGHQVQVFEQNDDVGGVWKYESSVEDDPLGLKSQRKVHTSLYQNLRTNLPREVMSYSDFEFGPEFSEGGLRFPHHTAVQKYLKAYAEEKDLRPLISFGRAVANIEPDQSSPGCWKLSHSSIAGDDEKTEDFDVVMVCNGHYSEVSMPEFPGLSTFSGHTIHSHNYREPSGYQGQRVLVVGASASGEDISREVAGVAEKVFISARSWQNPEWGKPGTAPHGPKGNIQRCGVVKKISGGTVEFMDGRVEDDIGSIVFCTGYKYHFPFLQNSDVVSVRENHVSPLYKQMFPPSMPTIAFIGLPAKIIPFPQFELQSLYAAKVWSGEIHLPSEEDMAQEIESEVSKKTMRGVPTKYFHVQGGEQFEYNAELARLCGVSAPEEWRRLMHDDVSKSKRAFPDDYRNMPLPTVEEYNAKIASVMAARL